MVKEEDHFQLREKQDVWEKEKRRQGGWSGTLREEEAGDKVEEGTAEARIYRALRYILPVRE